MSPSVGSALSRAMISSLAVKVISFALTIGVVRNTSVSDYGKIAVNFQLITSLSLFILKEGVRRAAFREPNISSGRSMMLLGSLVSTVVITPLVLVGYCLVIEPLSLTTVLTLFASVVVESLSELFMFEQTKVHNDLASRSVTETFSNLIRSAVLVLCVVNRMGADTSFVISQLAAAISALVLSSRGVTLSFAWSSFPPGDLLQMCLMSGQKLLLTEGERMLTLAFMSADEIGQLGLVTNIGSLVLRLVFAPIEDVAFSAFTQSTCSDKDDKTNTRTLRSLLLVESSIGLLGVCFGPPLARTAVRVLYGAEWALNEPFILLLQTYCGLLFLFSLNGPLEAFFIATANNGKLKQHVWFQWIAFFGLILTTWLLHGQIGALAVIAGNAACMVIRILWASSIFTRWSDAVHVSTGKVVLGITSVGGVSLVIASIADVKTDLVRTGITAVFATLALGLIYRPLRSALADLKPHPVDKNDAKTQ